MQRAESYSIANGDSASAIAASVSAQQRPAKDFVQDALKRLAATEHLGSYVHINTERALELAEDIDRRIKHGEQGLPLAGVPFIVKDNLYTQDMPTSGGNLSFRTFQPTENATTVQQLIDAGAVPIGKANLHELAFGITSANAGFGPVINPHDLSRVAGGSSGGTAVAIAAGIPFGLGTDTGGSIRIPAAFCGVYGFRPTTSRYSTRGVLTISPTRDTVGTMARSLDDLLLIDAILTRDSSPQPIPTLAQLRIGCPEDPYFEDLAPGVAECVQQTLQRLKDAGATLVPVDGRELHRLDAEHGFCIAAYEAKQEWEQFCAERLRVPFAEFVESIHSSDVRNIFRLFNSPDMFSDAQYLAARQGVNAIKRCYDDIFHRNHIDCLIMPTVACEAPTLVEAAHDQPSEHSLGLFAQVARQASPATLAGLPSVSMPIGFSAATGVPVGLLCEGPISNDRRILAIAKCIEQAI